MSDRDTSGRFQKGVSANPKGRPRKVQTNGMANAAVLTAASAPVFVVENGKRRKIPKLDAAAAQLANKGAAGDIRAGKQLLDMTARAEAEQRLAVPVNDSLTESDQQILERFLADHRRHVLAGGL